MRGRIVWRRGRRFGSMWRGVLSRACRGGVGGSSFLVNGGEGVWRLDLLWCWVGVKEDGCEMVGWALRKLARCGTRSNPISRLWLLCDCFARGGICIVGEELN